MVQLPRIALGTVQAEADHRPVLWALLNLLERHELQAQTFLSQARFDSLDGVLLPTNLDRHYLDSWLMSRRVCQELFYYQGTRDCDLALVEGKYGDRMGSSIGGSTDDPLHGGSLDTLCQWLNLPRVAVVDASQLQACRLPQLPEGLDGLVLDRVADTEQGHRLRVTLEAIVGVPVLGDLGQLQQLRALIAGLPAGALPSRELCRALGDRLAPGFRLDRLLQIANGRPYPAVSNNLFTGKRAGQLNVAFAYDEAFNCYFPDTLDLLEDQGATVRDFSPLRDDCLPPGTDVVYLGCGRAARYAEQLAGNHCMKQALRGHALRGGRVYAEGCGLAYLCHSMDLHDGRHLPMAGILPAVATFHQHPGPLSPVEVTLGTDTWLGRSSWRLRGYLHRNWSIQPTGQLVSYATEPQHHLDLVGRGNVVGSRLHVNFAALPHLLASFFEPHRASATSPVS